MIKTILFTATITIAGLLNPAMAQTKGSANNSKADVKFLDDITVEVGPSQVVSEPVNSYKSKTEVGAKKDIVNTSSDIETANKLQFKYALLLNTEVEMVRNVNLIKVIDEWMGTRYRMGGTSKLGIDCSALMQVFFTAFYGVSLPRTAREQYNFSNRISRTELKEGDLVFFNTTGGVSHVGMYLQNNKFVHASSGGVTISDLYEDYWVRKFIGVGRIQNVQPSMALASKP